MIVCRGGWRQAEIFRIMEKNSRSLRVLVVDDEPLIRWSLAETLAHSGHEVIEAGDAMGALRTLNNTQESVDVVLLDFRLPDSHDLTLLSLIRRLAPDTSIILMTAYGSPEITEGALQLGAYTVVHKPFEMHDMAALILRAHDERTH
jgi:DNA-binding NtrC family response regulator